MILSDGSLRELLPQLIKDPDYSLINPASVDIRIGREIMVETPTGLSPVDFSRTSEDRPYYVRSKEFLLAATLEHLLVPNGFAIELKLKSSIARQGWNHSLAFWFDPGWDGIGTMELHNLSLFRALPLWCGMRFGQIIVHQLDKNSEKPYQGKYQHASSVEPSKS